MLSIKWFSILITDKLNHSEKDCFFSWAITAQQLVLLPYYWYGTRTQARTEGLGMRLLDSVTSVHV